MPAEFIEPVENAFNYNSSWFEFVQDQQPGGSHFSSDGPQEATLRGFIPGNQVRSAAKYFLGHAYADTAAPWRLHRVQPHFHPQYPWLRACEFSASGFGVVANPSNVDFKPYEFSIFDETLTARTATYTDAALEVRYRAQAGMYFLSDDDLEDPTQEWFRNTIFLPPESVVEALQITGGVSQLTFAETGDTGPAVGTKFPAPVAILQHKQNIRILWKHVPIEYLSTDPNQFWPSKINECVGKVNSDWFLGEEDVGYAPGTMLMQPPTYEQFPWWVASDDNARPLTGVNIVLNFSFFDPPNGNPDSEFRGHNLMPWGGNGVAASGGDGFYYLATRDGTTTGEPLLQEADFNAIFTHVSDEDFPTTP